jgi:hypothetical protein
MAMFTLNDLENLKRTGTSVQDIHYNLSNAILSSETVAANVRTIDKATGQFEIVLTGTIGHKALAKEVRPDVQKPRV